MTSSTLTSPGIKAPGDYIEDVMTSVKAKNPAEPEFHQAVNCVLDSLGGTSRHSRCDRDSRAPLFGHN